MVLNFVSFFSFSAREGIQGIDLDWFSSIRTPQDKYYFLEFLKEARPLWYKQGMLKLSIPLHVGQTLPRWAYDLIDRIHLMVYDSPSVTSQPKIETEQLRITYAQRGIDYLIQSGCPPHKIWLGIPFFGSKLDAPGITMTFHEALENQKESSSSMSLDAMEELFNGYQWDSPSVIGEKITFVKEHALGGVFIWELGQDSHSSKKESAGTLLETMVAMSRNFVSSQRNDEL